MLVLAAVVAADGPSSWWSRSPRSPRRPGRPRARRPWPCSRAWSASHGSARRTRSSTRCRISASSSVRRSARCCSSSRPTRWRSWPTRATFAVSALLISRMRDRSAPRGERVGDGTVAQIAYGFRVVRADTVCRAAVPRRGHGRVHVWRADRAAGRVRGARLGLGAGGYGVLLAAAGVGGLLSALVNGRLATSSRVSLVVVTAGALVVRDPARVRRSSTGLRGARRDGGRRRRPGGLRGGRRDGARPRSSRPTRSAA